MSATAITRQRMTADEFLEWKPGDDTRWQLVNGELEEMAPAASDHGKIHAAITRLLDAHLGSQGDRLAVAVAPGIQPNILADVNVRIPELAVAPIDRSPGRKLLLDPILAVEILSPSNVSQTWADIWSYTSIPSLQEILVIYSQAVGAELIRRSPDGAWPDRTALIESGDVTLDSVALTFPLARLYRTTGLLAPR